jgi:glycosyltransferase involved in cell wall biosynthesis
VAARILVIGALPPPIGGTSVSLRELVLALRERGTVVHEIDCSVRTAPLGQLRTLIRALGQAFKFGRQVDVITCHMSDRGALTAAPFFQLLARLLRKPFVYRQFGGEMHYTYGRLNPLRQWLFRRTILRSDIVLLQTREQVRYFGPLCESAVEWFPTSRRDAGARYEAHFARGNRDTLRCIFVGHLRAAKGVLEAIAAVGEVAQAELHIYGPLVDLREEQLAAPRVFYHGTLAPNAVQTELAAADVLLFPTYHAGEGYSGTLVEAAMAGLPVVASRWQALPEMFPDDELLFIEPRSVSGIVQVLRDIAARKIDLQQLSARMRSRSRDFDANDVFARFETLCTNLTAGRPGRSLP